EVCEARGPVPAPRAAVDDDALRVEIAARGDVVEDAREFALGAGHDLAYGRLPRSRHIEGEVGDAVVEVGVVPERGVFLAAVQAPDGEHERGGADADGQAQVADDLLAFEGNTHYLDRRVRDLRVGGEGFERLFVRLHFSRRVLQREAREEVVLE